MSFELSEFTLYCVEKKKKSEVLHDFIRSNPFCFPSAELVIGNHIPERLFDLLLTTFCDGDVNVPKTFSTLTVCKVFLRAQSCCS